MARKSTGGKKPDQKNNPKNKKNPESSTRTKLPEKPQQPRPEHPEDGYVMRHFYCGVESSLTCTRIAVIEKIPSADELNNGKRYYNTIRGIDIFYAEVEEMATKIAAGITELMIRLTKQPNTWREWAQIDNIVVVFPEPVRDTKMGQLETSFNEKYVVKKRVIKPDATEEEVNEEKRKQKEEDAVMIGRKMSVMTEIEMVVQTHFRFGEEGLAVQCGVDAACLYNKKSGKMRQLDTIPSASGAGGAYWIARTVHSLVGRCFEKQHMRLFHPARYYPTRKEDYPDLVPDLTKIVDMIASSFDIEPVQVCEVFEMMFSNHFKHRYALLSEKFAKEADNKKEEHETIRQVFDWAGETIGNLAAHNIMEWHPISQPDWSNPLAKEVPPLPILIYGRVFDSFNMLERGFLNSLSKSGIAQVQLLRKCENSAAAAAVLAARFCCDTDEEKAAYEISEPEEIYEATLQKIPHVPYEGWKRTPTADDSATTQTPAVEA